MAEGSNRMVKQFFFPTRTDTHTQGFLLSFCGGDSLTYPWVNGLLSSWASSGRCQQNKHTLLAAGRMDVGTAIDRQE